ncbi:kinase-like domain [Cordyceps militaris]|uniref:Kinase-like domain n=1 Tax=Cordyceps militaris TaxID=73501 RepID=A0A2H4SAS8_CORMI|nr:kinase-like domain [Cordyceps militaris]
MEASKKPTAETADFASSAQKGKLHSSISSQLWLVFSELNHERITNEANALKLISEQTSIPVPRLLDHGELPDGRRYLVTEFIDGPTLKEMGSQCCSRPAGQKHTEEKPCKTCLHQAYSNALDFIGTIVLPQLADLRSHHRGINGFVMPPSWLTPDAQPPWKGKKSFKTLPSKNAEYVFQHGDIAPQNIIINRQTLQVEALIDWEHAGYFPPGMERWPGTLDIGAYRKRADGQADAISKFLLDEYLECYEEWTDKNELQKLVDAGELPDPGRQMEKKERDKPVLKNVVVDVIGLDALARLSCFAVCAPYLVCQRLAEATCAVLGRISDPDRTRKLADLVHDSAKVISLLLWASIENNEAPIVHGCAKAEPFHQSVIASFHSRFSSRAQKEVKAIPDRRCSLDENQRHCSLLSTTKAVSQTQASKLCVRT